MIFDSPERLTVALDREDLSDLGVTVGELDYATPKTRRILTDLLERIGADALLEGGGRRLVEVIPDREGGCMICFTLLRRTVPVARRGEEAVWAFPDAGTLLEAAEALRSLPPRYGVRLYRMEEGYRLVLCGQSRAQEHLLSEYASPVADAGGRATAEHGRLLTDQLLSELPLSGRPRREGP